MATLVKMRLYLLIFLNLRVMMALFRDLSEVESVPVDVTECEGELSLFGNVSEDEAVPVAVPECEGESVPLWKS